MASPTILITISRGGTARNILQTEVYRVLLDSGFRLVILTPAYDDPRFRREFERPGVVFEPLREPRWTWRDNLLVGMHKGLVYNASTVMRDRYGIYSPAEANFLRYVAKRLVFPPLAKIGALKELARSLDAKLVPDTLYGELFDRYRPTAVFSTSVIEDMDAFVLKQARARGVPVIAMPKSWDNLSKMSVRVRPERMIVWGPYSREEALRFQNMREEEIAVCGIPQFDVYRDQSAAESREVFAGRVGLDPGKPILVYASEGKVAVHDPDIVRMLLAARACGALPTDLQIFIRPHFIYPQDGAKFATFSGSRGVVVDQSYRPSEKFRDRFDYSREQLHHLTNLLRHADVLVTSNSTLTLDASALDTPVINVAFDGYVKKPFAQSIAKWYTTEYYRRVVETDAPVVVRSELELVAAASDFLGDRGLRQTERRRLVEFFCGPVDGQSGRRVGEEVVRFTERL